MVGEQLGYNAKATGTGKKILLCVTGIRVSGGGNNQWLSYCMNRRTWPGHGGTVDFQKGAKVTRVSNSSRVTLIGDASFCTGGWFSNALIDQRDMGFWHGSSATKSAGTTADWQPAVPRHRFRQLPAHGRSCRPDSENRHRRDLRIQIYFHSPVGTREIPQ